MATYLEVAKMLEQVIPQFLKEGELHRPPKLLPWIEALSFSALHEADSLCATFSKSLACPPSSPELRLQVWLRLEYVQQSCTVLANEAIPDAPGQWTLEHGLIDMWHRYGLDWARQRYAGR